MLVEIQYHGNSRIENLNRFLFLIDLDDLENAIAVAFGQVVEILGLGTPWSGRDNQPGALSSANRRDPRNPYVQLNHIRRWLFDQRRWVLQAEWIYVQNDLVRVVLYPRDISARTASWNGRVSHRACIHQ